MEGKGMEAKVKSEDEETQPKPKPEPESELGLVTCILPVQMQPPRYMRLIV
jgi:hypothetical protein